MALRFRGYPDYDRQVVISFETAIARLIANINNLP